MENFIREIQYSQCVYLVTNAFSHSHPHHQHLLQPVKRQPFRMKSLKDESDESISSGQNVQGTRRPLLPTLPVDELWFHCYNSHGQDISAALFLCKCQKYWLQNTTPMQALQLTGQDGSWVFASACHVPSVGLHGSRRQAPESECGPPGQLHPPQEERTARVLLLHKTAFRTTTKSCSFFQWRKFYLDQHRCTAFLSSSSSCDRSLSSTHEKECYSQQTS